jgi:hypothetical protein
MKVQGQVNLFQRFGLGRLSTNITCDGVQYFTALAREIGYQAWDHPARALCHTQKGISRMPTAVLSLWALLFAFVGDPEAATTE